jgi:hypothetical protein
LYPPTALTFAEQIAPELADDLPLLQLLVAKPLRKPIRHLMLKGFQRDTATTN